MVQKQITKKQTTKNTLPKNYHQSLASFQFSNRLLQQKSSRFLQLCLSVVLPSVVVGDDDLAAGAPVLHHLRKAVAI